MPTMEPPPHVVIFPSPGMGHLIPLVEFSKRLIPQFSITFAIPTSGDPSSAQRSFLSSLPSSIQAVFLPPVDISDTPSDARIETIISLTAARSLPSLSQLLSDLISSGSRVVSLVVDLFGTDAFDVARHLSIPPYIFYPSTAMCLSFFLFLETLDRSVPCEYSHMPEPVHIPGCVPVHGRDLLDPVQDRTNDAYKWVLHHAKRYKMAEGIMVNSFEALEPGALQYLTTPEPGKPPVYPIGPLVQTGSGNKPSGSDCLNWLNQQPRGSVLFVNFGSGGSLSSEQQKELALGLEGSNQRFLWVVRVPSDSVANATYFNMDGQVDPLSSLPEGFLERIKGRGMVIPMWAPQIGVLSHRSTGGFLSHCGWNSVLESVVHGLPLIAWPLYAEQRMNAVSLTEVLKVGLPVKKGEDGVVRRDEIAKVGRELMEGEEGRGVQGRMKVLKEAAAVALSEEGSSTTALKGVIRTWMEEHKVSN